jgi:hypothetical protein
VTVRSNKPQTDYVTAFLSCSVRSEDAPLVAALDTKVLSPLGFRCLTVGRNVSLPEQTDDAIRNVIDQVDCLIGIATVRLEAADREFPNRTLRLASPYVLQETAMAHQRRLPFLIFKTGVTLQGVTQRNLYIEIRPYLRDGRPAFPGKKELVLSSLRALKTRALEYRKKRSRDDVVTAIGKLSAIVVGIQAFASFADWLQRPGCFGEFYYLDPQCKDYGYKGACEIEKLRRSS